MHVPDRSPVLVCLSFSCLTFLGMGACGREKPLSIAVGAGAGGAPGGGVDAAADGATAVDGGGDVVGRDGCPVASATRPAATPSWSAISGLKNAEAWYMSESAAYVAENLLDYQNTNGGWPKDIDMSLRSGVDVGAAKKNPKSMIDNGATTTQLRYMAFMLGSWPTCQPYADSFSHGMDFLFDAQYASTGGWPQVYPIEPDDYSRRITYNDNAMVKVMQIMRDIVYKNALFKFVGTDSVGRATAALNKGVDCMLKTQIVVNGVKTGWCAQHDEVTLLPAKARAYELPSHSGKEGAQVSAFLMGLDLARPDMPRQGIIEAVEAAVTFYASVKITGTRYVQGASDAGPEDSWIASDPAATPIWARFYDLEPPFRPFFCDRDGIKVYTLAEVGLERRGGYTWYVTDPIAILGATYPTWVTKWSIGRNVLTGAGADGGTAQPDGSVD